MRILAGYISRVVNDIANHVLNVVPVPRGVRGVRTNPPFEILLFNQNVLQMSSQKSPGLNVDRVYIGPTKHVGIITFSWLKSYYLSTVRIYLILKVLNYLNRMSSSFVLQSGYKADSES